MTIKLQVITKNGNSQLIKNMSFQYIEFKKKLDVYLHTQIVQTVKCWNTNS